MRKPPIALVVVGCLFCVAPAIAARKSPAKTKVPIVQSVQWIGNVTVSSATLGSRVSVKRGKPLNLAQLKLSVSLVEALYRDKGYYTVAVSTDVETVEPAKVVVHFMIDEGPVYHIGVIEVEGNRRINQKTIMRTLDIHPGDVFSQSKIFESHRNLYMTGYFNSIDFAYSTSTTHQVDIAVRLRERATRYLKGGFGYGTQTKETVSLGLEDLNFFGGARKFDLTATYSGFLTNPSHYRTALFQGNLTQPHILDSAYEAQTSLAREYANREAYDSISTTTRFGLGRRFSSAITASIKYRYSGTRLTRVTPLAFTPSFTNVSAVGPSFAYDNTNDPFLPTIGWRVLGLYEEGLNLFNGDVRFHKVEGRLGRFDRPFGKWVFFEGLQGGQILPATENDIIPIYERYFLGGANTVRGYSERELGPRSLRGEPLGGNAFIVGNFELRHPLYKKLWGVGFFDAGQIYPTDLGAFWPHIQAKGLNDFRYSTGGGLRFNSPVGAVRLEFGYKLNPVGQPGFLDRTAIHFSIGEIF
jgi:outer membrane protein insertion porin family